MNRIGMALAMGIFLSGCVSVPQAVSVEDDNLLVPLAQVQAAPKASAGMTARWGGTIASVSNLADRTMIEVVEFPLDSNGRPKVEDDKSGGRFRAYIQGFVDPAVLSVGKSVTIRGIIEASESGKVGEFAYDFPVLKADGWHLWQPKPERDPFYDRRYYYRDPFYDPFWPRPVIIVR